jgi:hypothetical protein
MLRYACLIFFLREKLLIKENEHMQASLAVAQKAVIDLTHKVVHLSDSLASRSREEIYDDVTCKHSHGMNVRSARSTKKLGQASLKRSVKSTRLADESGSETQRQAYALPQLFTATAPAVVATASVRNDTKQLQLDGYSGAQENKVDEKGFMSALTTARSVTSLNSCKARQDRFDSPDAHNSPATRPKTTAGSSSTRVRGRSKYPSPYKNPVTNGSSANNSETVFNVNNLTNLQKNTQASLERRTDTMGVLVVGEELQLRGKSQLITKYLQLFASCVKVAGNNGSQSRACSPSSTGIPCADSVTEAIRPTSNVHILDLSSMGLMDSELNIVVDNLRHVNTFTRTNAINLSRNMLTGTSAEKLALWMIALSDGEFDGRHGSNGRGVLEIDLRYNMVSKTLTVAMYSILSERFPCFQMSTASIQRFVSLLRSIPRPQITLTTLEADNTLVYIYGPARQPYQLPDTRQSLDPAKSGKSPGGFEEQTHTPPYLTAKTHKHMNLLVTIDFRHNEVRPIIPKNHRLNALGPVGSGNVDKFPCNNVMDTMDIRATSASLLPVPGGAVDSRDWSRGTVGAEGTTVFPSDRILKESKRLQREK